MSTKKVVPLRSVKMLLQTRIIEHPENNLHWISVVGEDSVSPTPTRMWKFNDSLLQVSVTDGFSEGSLIYVYAQAGRYAAEKLVPLFQIKVLCGAKKAFEEAARIWAILQSTEFLKLVEGT